jgi:ATP-dependent protease HslVU (ClpYQ) peptidase subunit
MSVVAAIKQNGKIYIGADSQITKGGTRLSLSNPNNYKIWRVKGAPNCLMASVGALREACVVRIIDNLVKEIDIVKDNIDYEYVVERIVLRIKSELEYYGYIDKDRKFEGFDSSYLFAYGDKLFYIASDSSVIEIDDCIAIGSGASDATIAISDVVIMNENLRKVEELIYIAKKTKQKVIQNIVFCLVIKVIIMVLNLIPTIEVPVWLAIFSDVGVSLIAIANSMIALGRFKREEKKLKKQKSQQDEEEY